MGVTQLHGVVFIICEVSPTILRFNATTHQRLTDFSVKDLSLPWDIAACEQTSQVYTADFAEYVWRVSADGADIKRWLPKAPSNTFRPWSLSVTSSRLLVTTRDPNQLIQFHSLGDELRLVQLPDDMQPHHAVESPTGTFIVSHTNYSQLLQHEVSELNMDGQVLRQFTGSRLGWPRHIAVDSHGNIFVADSDNSRILLLDAGLRLRRVIVDEYQLNFAKPRCLCYMEQSGQLLVGYAGGVTMFDVMG